MQQIMPLFFYYFTSLHTQPNLNIFLAKGLIYYAVHVCVYLCIYVLGQLHAWISFIMVVYNYLFSCVYLCAELTQQV